MAHSLSLSLAPESPSPPSLLRPIHTVSSTKQMFQKNKTLSPFFSFFFSFFLSFFFSFFLSFFQSGAIPAEVAAAPTNAFRLTHLPSHTAVIPHPLHLPISHHQRFLSHQSKEERLVACVSMLSPTPSLFSNETSKATEQSRRR